MSIKPTTPLALALADLGQRLRQRRISQDLSQAELADRAGVSVRTIERLEQGNSVGLNNFVQVLRGLRLMDALNQLVPEAEVRPLQHLGARQAPRQRASTRRARKPGGGSWTWGDRS